MITRSSNANKHPGQVVIDSVTRRSREVVQAERASRAADKEKIATAEQEGIDEVARIENDAREKKDSRPNKLTIPKARRVRKPATTQDDDWTVEAELQPEATKGKSSGSAITSGVTEATHRRSIEESSRVTPDEWEPQAAAASESESSNLEDDMDLDDEEPDTMTKKRSGKKSKKGLFMRERINKAAAELTQSGIAGSDLDVQKRKAGPNTELDPTERPTPKKARKGEAPSGLVSGWRKMVIVPSKPTGARHASVESRARPPPSVISTSTTHSRRAPSSTVSIRRANSTAPSTAHNGPEDDPAFTFGGLPSDEEELGPQDPKLVNKRGRSITRVHEIHTSPSRTKNSRRADSITAPRRVKNSDLPSGTTDLFIKKVLPLALKITGVLGPWEYPANESIIDCWNDVFGEQNDHPIMSGDVNGDIFWAVKRLVKRGISMWLHRFSLAAEKALIAEFDRQKITTVEEKASFVRFLLGDSDDISSKNRPFLWKSAYDSREDDDQHRLQGLFQGRLVTRTFFEHVSTTAPIDKEYELDDRPIGALIISIQAVHRALLYSVKGTFNPPSLRSRAFSKANWGDYDVTSQRGTVTTVKRASVFLKRIRGLKDQQWEDIYEAAREHDTANLKGVGSAGASDGGSDGSDSDELLDPMYDDIAV